VAKHDGLPRLASPERWIIRAATAATVDEIFADGG